MKRMEQKVIKFITQNNLIEPGDKLLVAFSGGPDSVFALLFLKKYSAKFSIDIAAVHFNHNLRGVESDKDEKFCERLCNEMSIPYFVVPLDVKSYSKKNKTSIEESARKLRYDNLEKLCRDKNYTKIVTAHNQSDNTETVLLNFFSGTGFSGFSGIPIRRNNIIRPVLCLTKSEIIDYLKENKIKFRVDSSNFSNEYKRNFLRNKIIPQLKENLNPSIDEAIFRSSKNLEKSFLVLDNEVKKSHKKYVKKESGFVRIKIELFESNRDWIAGEVLKNLLKTEFLHDFEYDDYEKLKSLLAIQKGKIVQLTSKLCASKETDSIKIFNAGIAREESFTINPGRSIKAGRFTFGISEVSKESIKFHSANKSEFISADKIGNDFILRKWEPGDKFIPLGMKNFKKVSDFLTDAKIETTDRKNWFILTNRNNIVWITGLRIDNRFKITPKTKKVLKLWMK